jgi:hypothetical protein
MNMNFYFWKWSISEPYYKSARPENKQQDNNVSEYDTQKNAINQSLAEDISYMDTDMATSNNRREDLDNKMADRELVLQRGANPFLQQSSYVNDIVVRDMFLKPVNTTQGRVKNGDENEN